MARVARYTKELITLYEQKGYWSAHYPVDYWEKNAREAPDCEALVFREQRFTWKTAVESINKLAIGLVKSGLARDDVLAIQAPNSATLMLLRLAAEKAGIISLLVPPTFSRSEIGAITERLPLAGVVVTSDKRGCQLASHYESRMSSIPLRLFTIGTTPMEGADHVDSWLKADHSACEVSRILEGRGFLPYEYSAIITTSGTTGTPQFVEHTACARTASGRVYIDRLKLNSGDVIAGMVSIFAGNCDLMVYHTAPQAGAKSVLLDRFDPETACRVIEAERVTCAVFVPTLLHRLLAYEGLRGHDLSSLRIVTSFGAVLAPEIAAKVEEVLDVKLIQGYGASDYGSLASTSIDDPRSVRLAGVGRALTGTDLRICDDTGSEVPVGVRGRIYARGPHCIGGFVGDAVATEKKWESGYCEMGDLGYLDEDGYLWLSGRAREIIIRGGQNIIPAEIEDVILGHPGVAEVAVIGIPDTEMGERVCAVVVPERDSVLTLESIISHLRARGLANFKLPERLLRLHSMPLNPAGTKIDKGALTEIVRRANKIMERSSAVSHSEYYLSASSHK